MLVIEDGPSQEVDSTMQSPDPTGLLQIPDVTKDEHNKTENENAVETDDFELTSSRQPDLNGEPYEIKLSIEAEQLLHFMSFFYKKVLVPPYWMSYLTEVETKEMFKYGMTIPAKPIEKKYKLRTSQSLLPKQDVYYMLYQFINSCCDEPKPKQKVLRFFASYIQDFEPILLGGEAALNFSKNIKSVKSTSGNFELKDYLP